MAVIIASRNEKELILVREMMETAQKIMKMNDAKREELRKNGIPCDVVVYYKRIDEKPEDQKSTQ